jgi:hypothetical protein
VQQALAVNVGCQKVKGLRSLSYLAFEPGLRLSKALKFRVEGNAEYI